MIMVQNLNKVENLYDTIAKEWAETQNNPATMLQPADYDQMLINTTANGHKDICQIAKDWGADDFNGMLNEASEFGHKELCQLAKDWGATDFNQMLINATANGYNDICQLAIEWGANALDL